MIESPNICQHCNDIIFHFLSELGNDYWLHESSGVVDCRLKATPGNFTSPQAVAS